MSLIRLNIVHKSYADKPILHEIYWRVAAGERVGLQETLDLSSQEMNQGLRLGCFAQFSSLDGASTVEQVLYELFQNIHLERMG
jgi:hypothetical protein